MKRVVLAVGLVLAAGCGADPMVRTLAVGEEAIVYETPERIAKWDGIDKTHASTDVGRVAFGTRVRVTRDPGPSDDNTRRLVVLLLEGEYRDKTAIVPRYELKPIN